MMTERVELFGFEDSVYTWVARLTLAAEGVPYAAVHVNPYDERPADDAMLHPFGKVPALRHGPVTLYETAVLIRYIHRAFSGPDLQPADALAQARIDQVIAIVDAHGYWPMVRQIFAHRVHRPHEGLQPDEGVVTEGLRDAQPVLDAMEKIAASGTVLTGAQVTLADCHLLR